MKKTTKLCLELIILVNLVYQVFESPVFNSCSGVVCENDGMCQSDETSYKCICADGFVGDHCERKIIDKRAAACKGKGCTTNTTDPCANVVCVHGNCSAGTCICDTGYIGLSCNASDNCYGVNCNHGKCNNGTCTCDAGYTGTNCTLQIIDGAWSGWSTTSSCSTTCGDGTQSFSRSCDSPPPQNGGQQCTGLSTKLKACYIQACPVDGGWSAWAVFSNCTVSCGGGTQTYTRFCNNPVPAYGGANCSGPDKMTDSCNTQPCPIDGGWSPWAVFSSCSVSCGGGTQAYTRSCNNPAPAYGGAQCSGADNTSDTCNTHPCPIDGGWSAWAVFSSCSVSCGGGTQSYTRSCKNPVPAYGGANCSEADNKTDACNSQPCPIDGGWSAWAVFSSCSGSCGGGTQSYTRSCNNPVPAYGGANCSGPDHLTDSCNTQPCPIDGGWSSWTVFSSCSVSCGGGTQIYTRSCNNPAPAYGGANCSGADNKTDACNTQPCPIDGGWSPWSVFSSCNVSCGGGTQTYTRSCNNPAPAYGGAQCSGDDNKSDTCNTQPCPIDGGWSAWTVFSSCSVSCGGGTQIYTRSCNNPVPAYGGSQCLGANNMTESCNTQSCPINGGWSDWAVFSSCTISCGGGTQIYTRSCNNPVPAYEGEQCAGGDNMTNSCNMQPCPIDGGWSGWDVFSNCSVNCGVGTQILTRYCNNPIPAYSGAQCLGADNMTSSCNMKPCPIDGDWSEWAVSSSCSVSCGEGSLTYTRSCTNPIPKYSGVQCSGADTMTTGCNHQDCPIDGGWSEWVVSSSCSVSCGGGSQTSTRSCNNPIPAYGGAQCLGADTMTTACNRQDCPIDGGWSEWDISSSCSVSCGGGTQTSTRSCNNPIAAYGGAQCLGADTMTIACRTQDCLIDGGWSDWTVSSNCTVNCGGGVLTLKRSCNNPIPAYGGAQCLGTDTMSDACNMQDCPNSQMPSSPMPFSTGDKLQGSFTTPQVTREDMESFPISYTTEDILISTLSAHDTEMSPVSYMTMEQLQDSSLIPQVTRDSRDSFPIQYTTEAYSISHMTVDGIGSFSVPYKTIEQLQATSSIPQMTRGGMQSFPIPYTTEAKLVISSSMATTTSARTLTMESVPIAVTTTSTAPIAFNEAEAYYDLAKSWGSGSVSVNISWKVLGITVAIIIMNFISAVNNIIN